jgi:hypothetical protein
MIPTAIGDQTVSRSHYDFGSPGSNSLRLVQGTIQELKLAAANETLPAKSDVLEIEKHPSGRAKKGFHDPKPGSFGQPALVHDPSKMSKE